MDIGIRYSNEFNQEAVNQVKVHYSVNDFAEPLIRAPVFHPKESLLT